MAFTSWEDLKTDILDAIADHVAGNPVVKEYEIGSRRMQYRTLDELTDLYNTVDKLASKASGVSRSSYGRHRRFQ